MRESTVEKYFVKRVKEEGGEVRKIRFLDRNGAPDRLALFPYGENYWVELKAPGKKAELHQLREHKRLRKKGQRVLVIDRIALVNRFFHDRRVRLRWEKLLKERRFS